MSGSNLLFRATYRGNPVELGLAGDAELASIAGCVSLASTLFRHSYRLGTEDLSLELQSHLAHALCTWGFAHVGP